MSFSGIRVVSSSTQLLQLLLLAVTVAAESTSVQQPFVYLNDTCTAFQGRLSASAASLTACMSNAARPFTLCTQCYGAKATMDNVQAELDHYPTCSQYLLQSDSVQVLARTNDFFVSIWQAGGCSNCLSGNGSSYWPSIADFLHHVTDLRACFDKYTVDTPDFDPNFNGSAQELCRNCYDAFVDVKDRFKALDDTQQHCMDALDALNVSRRLWGEKFHCDPQDASVWPIPVIVAAYIVAALFYVGARGQVEITWRRLLKQKRLGGIVFANAGVAEPVMSTNST